MIYRHLLLALVPMISAFMPRFSFLNTNMQPMQVMSSSSQSRFPNFFSKFVPKVYYYQVQTTTTPAPTKSPLQKCKDKDGFYVNGMCYIYVDTLASYDDAITNCPADHGAGSILWIPNLNDLELYRKIVESQPGDFFDAPDEEVWMNLRNCINADPANLANFATNHLCLATIMDGATNLVDCNVLKWTGAGAFYVGEDTCADMKHYVCKVPI